MKKNRSWRSISGLIRPHRTAIIWLNLLTVLQAVLQVALAVVTKSVIDAAVYNTGYFLHWGAVLCLLLLSLVLMHAFGSWLAGSTADKCVARMRHSLLDAAAHSSKERLEEYHSGQLLSRGMEDVYTVCDGFVGAIPSALGQVTRLLGAFAAVVIMYPAIAPLLILASIFIVAATAVLRPILRKQHKQVRKADELIMSGLQENLQQIELIQSLQMEETSLNGFDKRLKTSLKRRRTRRFWTVGISSSLSFISQMGTGAMLLWGGMQVAANRISYGSLTAMLELLALLRSPVVGLSGIWNRFAAIEVSANRLKELLDHQGEEKSPEQDLGKIHAVVFENVSFHYPGEEVPVLENFNVRLPLENWVCLTGLSGKGKSTIFKLILGLYEPQQGSVYLESDKGRIPCGQQTRYLFAYVPQDYSLFSGSVLDNLLLAAPDADEARRKMALSVAQADFVWELTAGEQTQVLENSGLSKGQLQRIAIARAVLMDREIFLLDECTSALDAQTEEALIKSLAALGKQAILVTHRPDALQDTPNITFVEMEK